MVELEQASSSRPVQPAAAIVARRAAAKLSRYCTDEIIEERYGVGCIQFNVVQRDRCVERRVVARASELSLEIEREGSLLSAEQG